MFRAFLPGGAFVPAASGSTPAALPAQASGERVPSAPDRSTHKA
jgi:hypothetical protein